MSAGLCTKFDCVVFSGGGAKGAYGAGAAKALTEYRKAKNVDSTICWLGASAGALNATVMAMNDADTSLRIWRQMSNWRVLDVWITNKHIQVAKRWLRVGSRRRAFYELKSAFERFRFAAINARL